MKIKINTKVTINISETANKPGIDVSNLETAPVLNESQKSIFDGLVASLFKEPAVKTEECVWPEVGNPLQFKEFKQATGLSSGWRKSPDEKKKVRLPFGTSQYENIMMNALSSTIADLLKDNETTVTIADWNEFVENVNSKL